MDRTDYPTIPTTISHTASLGALRDRLQRVQLLNTEIAEWLAERRKVEEAYVLGLQKLVKKPAPNDSSDLGVFQGPWQRIITSTASLATSHHLFSQKLETEVERPIKEFANTNREWNSLRTMEGNLTSLAKAIDSSEDKVEKMKKKGKRAEPSKVAEATTGLRDAQGNWESQSPFVFEQLQAVDEARVTQLRESLTRMQTLELDQADHIKTLMEGTVQALLDVVTADEIKAYTNRVCGGKAANAVRPGSQRAGMGRTPTIQTPSIVTDDSVSVQSSGSAEKSHSLGGNLRRLGTVLKGRSNRNSTIFGSYNHSPIENRASNDRLGLGSSRGLGFSTHSPNTSSHNLSVPSGENSSAARDQADRTENSVSSPQSPVVTSPTSPAKAETQNNNLPTIVTNNEPVKDSEGYTVPPPQKSLIEEVPDAEILDGEMEQTPPGFKLEIRNDVIPEEETEAADAMSKVATTLRAQQTVSKRNRGRRDVRATIYGGLPDANGEMINGIENYTPPASENATTISAGDHQASPQTSSTFGPSNLDTNVTPLTAAALNNSVSSPFTPMKMTRTSTLASDAGSDTQSITSGLSAGSQGAIAVRHPVMQEPGLSASLIEHVSATFESGEVSKVNVMGEIALAYNVAEETSAQPTETLRFDQYGTLEKISPNQSHVTNGQRLGEYSINLSSLRGISIAFRYQLKMDEVSAKTYPPIIVTPAWKIEEHQASLIVNYKPNPLFNKKNSDGLFSSPTLRNLVFITGIEGVQATSCQSKPTATFFKERSRIAWRIPEAKLSEEKGGKLIARLFTDGLAKSLPIEVRWEIFGSDDIRSAGSGVGIETFHHVEVEKDPFADDIEDSGDAKGEWKEVHTVRKLVSGKYTAA